MSRKLCVKADTLEEACEPFGIDAAALAKTIEQWNGYVDAGADPDFNYRGAMHKIDTPPYYIMTYKPAVHYTMGGLRINPNAEVLDTAGAPIPGLFAAGEVAGHKMERTGWAPPPWPTSTRSAASPATTPPTTSDSVSHTPPLDGPLGYVRGARPLAPLAPLFKHPE